MKYYLMMFDIPLNKETHPNQTMSGAHSDDLIH